MVKHGFNENIIIPYFDEVNKKYTDLVLNNPDDERHAASNHVKKSPYLKKHLYESIISTTQVGLGKNRDVIGVNLLN